MSRARHKRHHGHKAEGGPVTWKGGNQRVIAEAHERKHGGRVHHEHGEGEEAKHHAGKRKRGGRAHHKDEHGHHHEHHKRARGGAVGSDKRPLSSAASIKFLPEEKGGGKGAGPANEQGEH